MLTAPARTTAPLSLSEQLDAMLSGWLERRARTGGPAAPGATAKAVVCVAADQVAQVEEFAGRWDLTVRDTGPGEGRCAVLTVEGRALAVEGLTEITSMYRR
jgi:hypothetical protein